VIERLPGDIAPNSTTYEIRVPATSRLSLHAMNPR
jgi:hypothetical protein